MTNLVLAATIAVVTNWTHWMPLQQIGSDKHLCFDQGQIFTNVTVTASNRIVLLSASIPGKKLDELRAHIVNTTNATDNAENP